MMLQDNVSGGDYVIRNMVRNGLKPAIASGHTGLDQDGAHTSPSRHFDVARLIADYPGARRIKVQITASAFEKADGRLAALAASFQFAALPWKAAVGMVRADIDCIKVGTLSS